MNAREARMTTAIRFGVDLHDRIAAAAKERDMSINQMVVALCEYALPRLKSPAPTNLFIEEDDDVDRP